jgi:nucleoside-diphosphate-sugar epimerase
MYIHRGSEMKILITGGTGFTGSALVLRLLSQGHSVRSLDNQRGIFFENIEGAGGDIVLGSITDPDIVEKSMEGIEFVFHLAAAFRELDVPDKHYYDVNVNGTRNVLEAAKNHDVEKFIYCSTQGVHGHIENPPGDENSPIAPADYYQKTKYEGELVVHDYIREGMNATILRPTAIYGPGDTGRFLMIYKYAKKGYFPMFGNGNTFYHPVYIDNLVDAFLSVMEPERGRAETYIIADEDYLSIMDLVQKVGQAMDVDLKIYNLPIMPLMIAGHICEKACKPFGITPPIFPRRVDWYRQIRAFKIDKAKKELGYYPAIGIDEGLRRTAKWYVKEGYL